MAAYGASKSGVDSFGRDLRIELRHTGTDVGVAYFGLVDTEMVQEMATVNGFGAILGSLPGPVGKRTPVRDAARAVVDGIERRSQAVYAPSLARFVVAGLSMVRLVDGVIHRMPALAKRLAAAADSNTTP